MLHLMEEDRVSLGDYDDANSELDENRGDVPGEIYGELSQGDGSSSNEGECSGSFLELHRNRPRLRARRSSRKCWAEEGLENEDAGAENRALVSPQNVRARRVAMFMWGFARGGFADRGAAGAALLLRHGAGFPSPH